MCIRDRYNGNGVDINRNFDCNWTANPQDSGGVQAGRGGTAPFSEPESRALGDFIGTYRPVSYTHLDVYKRQVPLRSG